METKETIRIKRMSQICGLSAFNLRYYEMRGLIKPLRASHNQYRKYELNQAQTDRIAFLVTLIKLKLSIDDLRSIMNIYDDPKSLTAENIEFLEKHIEHFTKVVDNLKFLLHKK